MLRRTLQGAVVAAAATGGANFAAAQTVYGGVDAAVNAWETLSFGDKDSEIGTDLSGFAGVKFGSGLFVEGELRFKDAEDDLSDSTQNLQHSKLGALRIGVERGALTGEVILGGFETTTGDGNVAATFVTLGGSYVVSDVLTLTGLVGHLDATNGDEFEDAPKDFNSVTLGALYRVNERTEIWANASYGDGKIDSENEMALVKEVSVGADYALAAPGLKAYGAVSYGDYFQGDEADNAYKTQLTVGLTWTFGESGKRSSRARVALPDYEGWTGVMAGTLE